MPIRVLHVDDEPDFARLVSEFLPRENGRIEVVTETRAEDALELLEGGSDGDENDGDGDIDCIVSDYEMPDMDGLELLERVRDDYPDLPFILFTGRGSEEVASEAISAGVTDYLRKGGTEKYELLANRIEKDVESVRSRHELSESRKRLNLFFEKSPLGVVEWDEEFRLVRMNERAEEILGYDESEIEGRSWDAIVPESDEEDVAEVVDELLENQSGYHSINENVTKDGERLICEWHNRVVTDSSGETIAVFSQFRDVTDRAEREQELQRNERRFEAVFDDPGMLVGLLDDEGKVIDVNTTAMEYTEATVDGVVGEPFWETPWWQTDEELRDDVRRWVRRATDGEYVEFEAEHVRPDGGTATVEGVVRPVMEEGEVTSLVASARDITERKEREHALERKRERLSELASFVDDDMSETVSAARRRLEAISDEDVNVGEAVSAVERADEMRAELADSLRRETVEETDEVDVRDTLEEVMETAGVPVSEAEVEVERAPCVKADGAALRVFVETLVVNTVENSGDGVRIRVGETEEGFYYEDDGDGIPDTYKDRVLVPGFSTKEDAGAGMGLAKARQIALGHGWNLHVDDARCLDGARFEVLTDGDG